jgi:hypothetical protein
MRERYARKNSRLSLGFLHEQLQRHPIVPRPGLAFAATRNFTRKFERSSAAAWITLQRVSWAMNSSARTVSQLSLLS